jgi:hydrogenase maturation protease
LLKPVLILCLGNEVLTDDSFGFWVAKSLERNQKISEKADVIFAPLAGFNLLELLHGRQRVLIVDTILTGKSPPGTLQLFPAGQMAPSIGLTCSHQISLPTALKLGAELGQSMPDSIDVLAVEAQDVETLGENPTPPVLAAVNPAIEQIESWVMKQ